MINDDLEKRRRRSLIFVKIKDFFEKNGTGNFTDCLKSKYNMDYGKKDDLAENWILLLNFFLSKIDFFNRKFRFFNENLHFLNDVKEKITKVANFP